MFAYKFRHWFFKWIQDEEGDIGITICNFITLIKYKEHTIVKFFYKGCPAAKYVRG